MSLRSLKFCYGAGNTFAEITAAATYVPRPFAPFLKLAFISELVLVWLFDVFHLPVKSGTFFLREWFVSTISRRYSRRLLIWPK